MGYFNSFLFAYLLGGLTLLPLVLSLFLIYSYFFLPPSSPQINHASASAVASIRRSNDDQYSLKSGTDELAEKFYRTHDTDVAAGYFVVCREYVPGGVNGKPPERTTPAGEVIAAESPSVYQAMYRSLFDRKQAPTIEPAKTTAKNAKRTRNMFYIVLRHGHLMLYDDASEVEVRYVISLTHHDVCIYGGEGAIPEGELWLKRNAICLSRRLESLGDLGGPTPPFYFFSENLSEKEDFYFAMLQNQTKMGKPPDRPPMQQDFDVKHIVTLVQRLHSSEEQLQTRWINAVLGRMFLALYRTPEMEEFVRTKIVKKISRVNKPNFISKIGLRSINMGNGAPFIINPRLKDLTVDGNCCVETDVQYTGNFRVEIAATVRIDLGQRFKAREVDIVLAVVLKELKGHLLIRFKPPPSNRAWIAFETMPDMVMDIEPVVSSKQITYGIIIRTIESKIREMVAESIVLPFWDDVPFLDTLAQRFRGGIWHQEAPEPDSTLDIPDESGGRSEVLEVSKEDPIKALKSKDDRTMSAPALSESATNTVKSHKKSGLSRDSGKGADLPSPSGKANGSPPRVIRSRTFSHTADPVLTADHGQMDGILSDFKNEEKSDATSAMIEISNRSPPASPKRTPNNSPPTDNQSSLESVFHSRESSIAESSRSLDEPTHDLPKRPSSAQMNETSLSMKGTANRSTTSLSSNKTRRSATLESSIRSVPLSVPSDKKPQNSLSLNTATTMAKKWGLTMFGRGDSIAGQGKSRPAGTPEEPIGRGHPLPPPGTPLPRPAKVNVKKNSISIPKRKPVSTTLQDHEPSEETKNHPRPRSSLPRRKPMLGADGATNRSDEILVVEAPYDSAPNSPADFGPDPNLAGRGTVEDAQLAV
ncbi:putative integral membrane protein conserved region-domain-containing protein [Aspergillus pseudoustus]|uniref:Integral membrane protein conserved region-domain-containing protein n=1 Tax=Aspergillus pseudoustus TaxID=1810923 RepID=A0ABR4KNN1_9EURO